MIKVSGLGHRRLNQRNLILAWLMFQKIYSIYRDINNKEARNSVINLTSMEGSI